MARRIPRVAGLLASLLIVSAPAAAQVVSSLHVGLGGFFPRGFDSRAADDVLVRDIQGESLGIDDVTDALAFEIRDFRSLHPFAEYNVAIGPHVEFGAGIATYGRRVPSLYRDIEEEGNGLDIEQDISMRVVPVTFMARFLPFGDFSTVQPYVGAGVSLLHFKYVESGDFVESDTLAIFTDQFKATGNTVGGVLAGGVRLPIKGDIYALTVEGRYIYGVGDIGGSDNGFLADKLDLSGGIFNVGLIVRF